MRWDRFFEDLEDQLASEWEAERAALDTEAERLRLSRVTLRERLVALAADAPAAAPTFEFCDGTALTALPTAVGADWVGLEASGFRAGAALAPFEGIAAIALREPDAVRSARPAPAAPRARIAERMTLGFVLRDLARRRVPVTAHLRDGTVLSGTIDRAGADHLDLALHECGMPRRSGEVTGFRMLPLHALAWVRVDASTPLV